MKALLLGLLLCLPAYVMAQDTPSDQTQTQADTQEAQVQDNTARIDDQERLTGNQNFILKVLAIVAPLVMIGLQAWLHRKMSAVAHSVDGVKTELVESTRKQALLQGAANERKANPRKKKTTKRRSAVR